MSVKVLIADDDGEILDCLSTLLSKIDEIELVGSVSTGFDAIRIAESRILDLALLDYQMPDLDGIEVSKRLLLINPNTKCVILTAFESRELLDSALIVGVSGFLTKDMLVDDISGSIRDVLDGKIALADRPITWITESYLSGLRSRVDASGFSSYFLRQGNVRQQLIRLISEGYSYRRISAMLCLGEGTIRQYASSIYRDLNISSRSELASLFFAAGLSN